MKDNKIATMIRLTPEAMQHLKSKGQRKASKYVESLIRADMPQPEATQPTEANTDAHQ